MAYDFNSDPTYQAYKSGGLAAALKQSGVNVDLTNVDLSQIEAIIRDANPRQIVTLVSEMSSASSVQDGMDLQTKAQVLMQDAQDAISTDPQGQLQSLGTGQSIPAASTTSGGINPSTQLPTGTDTSDYPGDTVQRDVSGEGLDNKWTAPTPGDPVQDPNLPGSTAPYVARLKDAAPQTQGLDVQNRTAGADETDYKRITGKDPRQAYDDYSASFREGMRRGQPQNFQDWIRQQAQTAMGPIYTAVRNLQAWYQNKYGQPMTDAMRGQLEDYFKNNPDQAAEAQGYALDQASVAKVIPANQATTSSVSQAAGGSTPVSPGQGPGQATSLLMGAGESILQAIPGLTSILTAPPASASQFRSNQDSANQQDFYNKTGRMPTQDELNKMFGMSQDEIATWLDTQAIQGSNLTVGQYGNAKQIAQGLWSKYFTGAPTDADIQHIAGFKDEKQAEDWARSQPSHIAGVNAGDYSSIHDVVSTLSSEYWHSPATPDLMQHVTSKLQK